MMIADESRLGVMDGFFRAYVRGTESAEDMTSQAYIWDNVPE